MWTPRDSKRGFTLLELLMVVIIIAILASIALPSYIRATEKARTSEALQLLSQLRSAQGRYRAQSANNVFTTSLNDLDVDAPASTSYWTYPPGTFTATSASFARKAGTFLGQTMGIGFNNGVICGTFNPYFGTSPVVCP